MLKLPNNFVSDALSVRTYHLRWINRLPLYYRRPIIHLLFKFCHCPKIESYIFCYSGILGPRICFEFWDHSYVSVKSSQENSDTPLEAKCPSPSTETETLPCSSLSSQQDLNGKSLLLHSRGKIFMLWNEKHFSVYGCASVR